MGIIVTAPSITRVLQYSRGKSHFARAKLTDSDQTVVKSENFATKFSSLIPYNSNAVPHHLDGTSSGRRRGLAKPVTNSHFCQKSERGPKRQGEVFCHYSHVCQSFHMYERAHIGTWPVATHEMTVMTCAL